MDTDIVWITLLQGFLYFIFMIRFKKKYFFLFPLFYISHTGDKVISPGGVSPHVKQPVTDRKDVIHYEKCLMRSPPMPPSDLKLDSPTSEFLMTILNI